MLTESPRAPVEIMITDHSTYHNDLYDCCFFFLSLSTDTMQSQHLPASTSTPVRGFFAPRNRFQDPSESTLHPNANTTTTDREQEAISHGQANGA
jgi:hypothetical protein